MSKQILLDYIPFEVTPQQINESLKENDGKLMTDIFPLGGVLDERDFT